MSFPAFGTPPPSKFGTPPPKSVSFNPISRTESQKLTLSPSELERWHQQNPAPKGQFRANPLPGENPASSIHGPSSMHFRNPGVPGQDQSWASAQERRDAALSASDRVTSEGVIIPATDPVRRQTGKQHVLEQAKRRAERNYPGGIYGGKNKTNKRKTMKKKQRKTKRKTMKKKQRKTKRKYRK